jgi:formiminoglutamase/guanidinobutyrase
MARAGSSSKDPRITRLFRDSGRADAVLLGYPDDRGVVAGGGRPGAAQGPSELRRTLAEYGTTWNLAAGDDLERLRLRDAGDVDPASGHTGIADAVATAFGTAGAVIGVGGGHDCTFGALIGASRALEGPLGGVSVDAHLDARPVEDGQVTSGNPFRLAIEEPAKVLDPARFTVLGADPRAGTRGSQEFVTDRGGQIVTRRQLGRMGAGETMIRALNRGGPGPLFVSVDLDVLAAAHAPGVSAPSPDGLSPREALDLVYEAGADPRVVYFDIMELNPSVDPAGLTARLSAALLVEFLHGLAARRKAE